MERQAVALNIITFQIAFYKYPVTFNDFKLRVVYSLHSHKQYTHRLQLLAKCIMVAACDGCADKDFSGNINLRVCLPVHLQSVSYAQRRSMMAGVGTNPADVGVLTNGVGGDHQHRCKTWLHDILIAITKIEDFLQTALKTSMFIKTTYVQKVQLNAIKN